MNRRLSILSVAYPLFPVSADSAGGAEQILYLLERGIVQAGHRSFVIAARGSQISGTLLPTRAASAQITEEDRRQAQREHLTCIAQAISQEQIDLIHFHGLDFCRYVPASGTKMLATLHLPPSWYSAEAFTDPRISLACVSQTQADAAPKSREYAVVENGINLIGASHRQPTREGLLWLGRICPEKGTDIALRVAHKLGMPLNVAGPVHGFATHLSYFDDQVRPLLDSRRCYVGPVRRPQKVQLLQEANAVLIPSLAPETSSLVAMEAISAGTPVIAFRSGALPEVVEHGRTGFIVDSEDEMADAVSSVTYIDSRVCLEQAAARFSATGMVERYLALYQDLVIMRRHLSIGTAPQETL